MDDPGIDERNRSTTQRLAVFGDRLSDAELAAEIDAPWTAAWLFAHIAFWDRFVLERWGLAAERGERAPMAVDDGLMDRINEALAAAVDVDPAPGGRRGVPGRRW
jgi:hypothetical protein